MYSSLRSAPAPATAAPRARKRRPKPQLTGCPTLPANLTRPARPPVVVGAGTAPPGTSAFTPARRHRLHVLAFAPPLSQASGVWWRAILAVSAAALILDFQEPPQRLPHDR